METPLPPAELVKRLGLADVDPDILLRALKHPSYVREGGRPAIESNQRLEFLGDAVLDLVLADELWKEGSGLSEGELTKLKSLLVREEALARVGRRMGLGDFLFLGRGEEESGGRQKPSLVADALEALIAAVYVSGGISRAREFVLEHFAEEVEAALNAGPADDAKTRLQELLQEHQRDLPVYRTHQASGPAHQPCFESECTFRGVTIGRGSGPSKREAEKRAAADALESTEVLSAALGVSRPRDASD